MIEPFNYTRLFPLGLQVIRRYFAKMEEGFEPYDLRVMRSYIDVAPVIEVLDRTGAVIAKPTISP